MFNAYSKKTSISDLTENAFSLTLRTLAFIGGEFVCICALAFKSAVLFTFYIIKRMYVYCTARLSCIYQVRDGAIEE